MTTALRRVRYPRWFRHPWHLVRCKDCHKMILSSNPRCAHCAAWRSGARAVSIGLVALTWLAAISVLFLLVVDAYLDFERGAF